MKTNSFKEVITAYLDQRATEDTLFAQKYANPKKKVDECCRYILGEARKIGAEVVMTDDDVFGLAVHYYDEDNIQIAKSGNCQVANIRVVDKPKKEAVQLSINQPHAKKTKAKREESKLQLSLFD